MMLGEPEKQAKRANHAGSKMFLFQAPSQHMQLFLRLRRFVGFDTSR